MVDDSAHSSGPDSLSLEARSIRAEMETLVLPVREGATPTGAPAVEIYLGTEPAQYRANRVFVWSIEQVRDPGREVRIHLMSELRGFDRRGWTTGFTNYRFAIPALQGGHGRAIYNDEDQIYQTDPGVLFDHPLGESGHLSISDTESSVMLIDCARMSGAWTLSAAQRGWKRTLLRKASKETGLRGDLEPGWNARDEEFVPGESHLLHYTTLHTQPWRPFPERFVYQKGAYTDLWHDLEREAIEAGFELFRREAPSRAFEERIESLRELPRSEMGSGIGLAGEIAASVESLLRRTKARSLVELQPDLRGDAVQAPGRFGLDSERRVGLLEFLSGLDVDETFDGVLCVDGLEDVPVWDVPWVVDALFARARRAVFVAVRTPESVPRRRFLRPPQGTTHTPAWWASHFEAASRRRPELTWELMTSQGAAFDAEQIRFQTGGARPDDRPPTVWTLSDGSPGNERQTEALASTLGWSHQRLRPLLGVSAGWPLASRGTHLRGLDPASETRGQLQPPWPDALIVAGRRVAPVARWVRRASRGRTRVIALGPKTATPVDAVDLAVTPRGAHLFPHPKRVETDRPLVVPADHEGPWLARLAELPGPRILLILGSGTKRLGLDGAAAEALGRLVAESAANLGAAVLVSASRHARPEVFEGCLRGLGRAAFVHRESPDQRPEERPWSALLEVADVFVMAGLGETSLAELCATGRPIFLSPQLQGGRGWLRRIRDAAIEAIVERAQARPLNDRGTTRPQEGIELLCARWIDRGWIRPRRDVEALRGRLVRAGHARLLRAPIRATDLEGFVPAENSEVGSVADRIRAMLGVRGDAASWE
jgi:hypothetical protein